MRICGIAYTYYEADNRVMRYAEALAARGDHVDIIAVAKPGTKRFEIINGVHIYRVQQREVNERSKFDYLFKLLLFLLTSFTQLTRLTCRGRYDVIHVHSIPDFEVFATWLAKLTGSKVILDIHDLVPEFFNSKFGKDEQSWLYKMLLWEEKLSISYADHVIIANHLWEKKLFLRSLKPEKCSVYLNYPDSDIFSPRSTKATHRDEYKIMFPGTLSWHQGVDVLIRAMKPVCEKIPNCKLYIYGVGSELPKLKVLAKELGLGEYVIFEDILPIYEVAQLMSECVLGVVPKRKDSFGNEAFSTKIFEFMSLGVPVLVSDTKIDTYYFNDDCVRFFTSGDHSELAEKIIHLIEHEDERKLMVENSMRYIQEHNWDIHSQRYFDLIDSLADTRETVSNISAVK
jgi:glycosyltransferase involved in cell wall biosynthesis